MHNVSGGSEILKGGRGVKRIKSRQSHCQSHRQNDGQNHLIRELAFSETLPNFVSSSNDRLQVQFIDGESEHRFRLRPFKRDLCLNLCLNLI